MGAGAMRHSLRPMGTPVEGTRLGQVRAVGADRLDRPRVRGMQDQVGGGARRPGRGDRVDDRRRRSRRRLRSTSLPAWPGPRPDRCSVRDMARLDRQPVVVHGGHGGQRTVLVAAEPWWATRALNPVWEPKGTGCVVGTNPVVSHGYGTASWISRHLRSFRRGGGRIWVLDPRRTESARLPTSTCPSGRAPTWPCWRPWPRPAGRWG